VAATDAICTGLASTRPCPIAAAARSMDAHPMIHRTRSPRAQTHTMRSQAA